MKETIQKHSIFKYTYYQNTHAIVKTPTHIGLHTHTLQNTYTHTHTHYKTS